MYKWDLIFYMRNGSMLSGMCEVPHANSGEVAKIFLGGSPNTYNSCYSDRSKTSTLLVRNDEIIAMDIGPSKGENV